MAADQAAAAAGALIGAAGVEYVANALATRGPPAIAEIQERCGLRPPLCKPVIGMLDQLGISRTDAHQYVLHRAMKELLDRIPGMATEQLEGLLEASFPYLGIEELRSIPIRVMERIQLVPPNYLKLLAEDKAVFQHLPPKVQQEVWEFDQNLLQLDAMPLVASYKYEIATVQQTIKMDEFLDWAQHAEYEERRARDEAPAEVAQRKVRRRRRAAGARPSWAGAWAGPGPELGPGPGLDGGPATRAPGCSVALRAVQAGLQPLPSPPSGPQVTRKMLRTRSKAIQTLRSMVGGGPPTMHGPRPLRAGSPRTPRLCALALAAQLLSAAAGPRPRWAPLRASTRASRT
jgi:hypothetical protein